MIKLLKYASIPIFISSVILYLCFFIAVDDIPEVSLDLPMPTDKIVHFLMYFGLSGLSSINYIYLKKGNISMVKLLIGAFLIPILYGGFIELLQHFFTDNRSGDWPDFLANILGSLSALPIALILKNFLLKNRSK